MQNQIPTKLVKLSLWLFVLNLGIACGAGLYEARITFPSWLSQSETGALIWNAEAARQSDSGLRFWAFVSTIPLSLLTLIQLPLAWKAHGKLRRWWLISLAAAMSDRVLTFAYFIPTMVALMKLQASSEQAVQTATLWGQMNYLRHALLLIAWIAALEAFVLFALSHKGQAE